MDILQPRLDVLSQDFVLAQAFKKTATHIRAHNWYADTLALDLASADFPSFLKKLKQRIADPEYSPEPLRIVPAPKSDQWTISAEGEWGPTDGSSLKAKLRPLAHVALVDQVICTALMICLADRVETLQGSTKPEHSYPNERPEVISYGNRLFCDDKDGKLRHRWGAAVLYRAYFEDYRSFVKRPEHAAEFLAPNADDVFIIQSDLSQFYDRVTPLLLHSRLWELYEEPDEQPFFELAERALCWRWAKEDSHEISNFEKENEIPDFSYVALPQGLVAAGFFANVALLKFDEALRQNIDASLSPDIQLLDSSRYVDDLRFVVKSKRAIEEVRKETIRWLQAQLETTAPGAIVSHSKTTCASLQGEQHPLVGQSTKMTRIQTQISAGMDADKGQSILDAILGLTASQQQHSAADEKRRIWNMTPVADVRDATVERFAAGRYRKTYRSIRPLLAGADVISHQSPIAEILPKATQNELDDQAYVFALDLVGSWVSDPSNVRQLRIALDIYPDPVILKNILGLLDQLTSKGVRKGRQRRIGWYCLSEIYRAVATESGIVPDAECLPSSVDVAAFRHIATEHASRTLAQRANSAPWYALQQAALITLVHGRADELPAFGTKLLRPYRQVAQESCSRQSNASARDRASIYSVLYRCFSINIELLRPLGKKTLQELWLVDPDLLTRLARTRSETHLPKRLASAIGSTVERCDVAQRNTVAEFVYNNSHRQDEAFDEIGLVHFARSLLKTLKGESVGSLPPESLIVDSFEKDGRVYLEVVGFDPLQNEYKAGPFQIPSWVPKSEAWRCQVGYLLRYLIRGSVDFSLPAAADLEKEPTYSSTNKHWFIRRLGHYNGYRELGTEWVAISEWFESLLCWLMRWPGMRKLRSEFDSIETLDDAIRLFEIRSATLLGSLHGTSNTPILTRSMDRLRRVNSPDELNTFRLCVVQTAIPDDDQIMNAFNKHDFELRDTTLRKAMQNHLATALRTAEQMIRFRQTHKAGGGEIDLVVLPELAANPNDIKNIILPFARYNRVAVLIGSTYEPAASRAGLVNSAIWLVPSRTSTGGVTYSMFRQGKEHLNKLEVAAVDAGAPLKSYRPAQWVVEFRNQRHERPLRMSAAVCYDATDLNLVSALRSRSDLFLVPALNRDIGSFDQMATALSYHMFQYVVIANNGKYGGSNAYAPLANKWNRQVFHTHGQAQATVSISEISDLSEYLERLFSPPNDSFKHPPAGLS